VVPAAAWAGETNKILSPEVTASAATEPAQPAAAAKPEPLELLPMSTPSTRPMQSMSSGYDGCHHHADESVLLTD